jgi:hypothetical protein
MSDLITQICHETNSRRLQEATPRDRPREAARWGRLAPPWCRPAPMGPAISPLPEVSSTAS